MRNLNKIITLLTVTFCVSFCSCTNEEAFANPTVAYAPAAAAVFAATNVDASTGQKPSEDVSSLLTDNGGTAQGAVESVDKGGKGALGNGIVNNAGHSETQKAEEIELGSKDMFALFKILIAKRGYVRDMIVRRQIAQMENRNNAESMFPQNDNADLKIKMTKRQQKIDLFQNVLNAFQKAKQHVATIKATYQKPSILKDVALPTITPDQPKETSSSVKETPTVNMDHKDTFDIFERSKQIYNLLADRGTLQYGADRHTATTSSHNTGREETARLSTGAVLKHNDQKAQRLASPERKGSQQPANSKTADTIPIAKRFQWFLKRYEYFDNLASGLVG